MVYGQDAIGQNGMEPWTKWYGQMDKMVKNFGIDFNSIELSLNE